MNPAYGQRPTVLAKGLVIALDAGGLRAQRALAFDVLDTTKFFRKSKES